MVTKTISFVSDARNDVPFRAKIDGLVPDHGFIIVPLPAGYHKNLRRTEFLRIVEESSFDGLLAVMSYELSEEI